jgi:hypothetical protein
MPHPYLGGVVRALETSANGTVQSDIAKHALISVYAASRDATEAFSLEETIVLRENAPANIDTVIEAVRRMDLTAKSLHAAAALTGTAARRTDDEGRGSLSDAAKTLMGFSIEVRKGAKRLLSDFELTEEALKS